MDISKDILENMDISKETLYKMSKFYDNNEDLQLEEIINIINKIKKIKIPENTEFFKYFWIKPRLRKDEKNSLDEIIVPRVVYK